MHTLFQPRWRVWLAVGILVAVAIIVVLVVAGGGGTGGSY
jgi:hypothetical protein